MTVRYLLDHRLLDLSAVSTTAAYHRYLADDGSVLSEDARRHHFTGYNTLYGTLLRAFGRERYHLASEATGITQTDDGVEIAFASGEHAPPPTWSWAPTGSPPSSGARWSRTCSRATAATSRGAGSSTRRT